MELWLNAVLIEKWLLKGELYMCMWLEWMMWENACFVKMWIDWKWWKWSMNVEMWDMWWNSEMWIENWNDDISGISVWGIVPDGKEDVW